MSSSCSLEASPKASHLHGGESVACFRAYLQCYGSSDFNYVFSFAAVLFLGNLRTHTFRLHLMLWRIIFLPHRKVVALVQFICSSTMCRSVPSASARYWVMININHVWFYPAGSIFSRHRAGIQSVAVANSFAGEREHNRCPRSKRQMRCEDRWRLIMTTCLPLLWVSLKSVIVRPFLLSSSVPCSS